MNIWGENRGEREMGREEIVLFCYRFQKSHGDGSEYGSAGVSVTMQLLVLSVFVVWNYRIGQTYMMCFLGMLHFTTIIIILILMLITRWDLSPWFYNQRNMISRSHGMIVQRMRPTQVVERPWIACWCKCNAIIQGRIKQERKVLLLFKQTFLFLTLISESWIRSLNNIATCSYHI